MEPVCLGGYCHQEASFHPRCHNRCNQIDTSEPFCKHTCRGLHTKQCENVSFDITGNTSDHSFAISETGCKGGDHSVSCCLQKSKNYTVECYSATENGWAGESLRVSDSEHISDLCQDFDNGKKSISFLRLDRAACAVKTIQVKTFAYAYEMSWSITPSRHECASTQVYDSNSIYNETCCLKSGDHVLECHDDAGDGWHNAYIEIDGIKHCDKFTQGKLIVASVTIAGPPVATATPCKKVEFISTIEGYGYENSWIVLDSMDEIIQCAGNNFKSRDRRKTNCCLTEGSYTIKCEDLTGDGWNGHIYKERSYVEIQGKKYCENFNSGAIKLANFNVSISSI